jgi:hypothetical protein
VYVQATFWECQRPQAQMLLSGTELWARAAAPIRRRLCHVKASQGVPARSVCRALCRDCLEMAKGAVARAGGAGGSSARRAAQAAAQGPIGEVIQARATFSS